MEQETLGSSPSSAANILTLKNILKTPQSELDTNLYDKIGLMNEQTNSWDQLSQYFDTSKNPDQIPAGAADNILIAWPPMIDILTSHLGNTQGKRAADLGCGGGGFCKRLQDLGFQVTGIDPSEGMISVARKSIPKSVQLVQGDSSKLKVEEERYNAVTSIMALQFDSDIEQTAHNISDSLATQGVAVITVFNPDYVTSCLRAGILFENFDSTDCPKTGFINLDGQQVPTYIRTAREYDEIFQILGLQKVAEVKPPFTREYLEKYPPDTPIDEPEFLILAYKKV